MNHTFRSVFNNATQSWAAVSENVTTRGRRASSVMLATAAIVAELGGSGVAFAAGPPAALQLPVGGVVSAGRATISQSTTANQAVMNISQTTQRADRKSVV